MLSTWKSEWLVAGTQKISVAWLNGSAKLFPSPVLPCVHSQNSSFETLKATVIFTSSSVQIRWSSKLLGAFKSVWVPPKMLGVIASRSGTQGFYFWLRWSCRLGNRRLVLSSPFCRGKSSLRDRKRVLLSLQVLSGKTFPHNGDRELCFLARVSQEPGASGSNPQWVTWGGVFNKLLRQM